jgi:hypothetical protein
MQMIQVGGSGLNHLRASLRQAGLPYDDVIYPGRRFYRFEVDGKWVAYIIQRLRHWVIGWQGHGARPAKRPGPKPRFQRF